MQLVYSAATVDWACGCGWVCMCIYLYVCMCVAFGGGKKWLFWWHSFVLTPDPKNSQTEQLAIYIYIYIYMCVLISKSLKRLRHEMSSSKRDRNDSFLFFIFSMIEWFKEMYVISVEPEKSLTIQLFNLFNFVGYNGASLRNEGNSLWANLSIFRCSFPSYSDCINIKIINNSYLWNKYLLRASIFVGDIFILYVIKFVWETQCMYLCDLTQPLHYG